MIVTYIKAHWRGLLEGLAVILVILLAYHSFHVPSYSVKKEESHQVVVDKKKQTKTKWKKKIVTTTTVKKDGTEVVQKTETDSGSKVAQVSNKGTDTVTKTVEKSIAHYSVDLTQLFPHWNLTQTYDPVNTQLSAGVRVLDTPFWVTVGTDGDFNMISAGIRVEFN